MNKSVKQWFVIDILCNDRNGMLTQLFNTVIKFHCIDCRQQVIDSFCFVFH